MSIVSIGSLGGNVYTVTYANGTVRTFDMAALKTSLGGNLSQLNTRLNNFLADKSADPSYRLFARVLTLNPLNVVVMNFHRSNLDANGNPPANWWVEAS